MAYRTLANSIALFTLLFAVAAADDSQQPPKKPTRKAGPVQLSGRLAKTEPNAKKRVEFSLIIGDEFEIYSERKHESLLPLKADLLDSKLQPIKSKVVYPKPKTIPFDKDLGGNYFVYDGKTKFAATCAPDAKPSCVRVFYHGYSKRGY